jgi:hypothetical protein
MKLGPRRLWLEYHQLMPQHRNFQGEILPESAEPQRVRQNYPVNGPRDFLTLLRNPRQLQDTFNMVEKIKADSRVQKFLHWFYRQQEGTFFRNRRNRNRIGQPFRRRRPLLVRCMETVLLSNLDALQLGLISQKELSISKSHGCPVLVSASNSGSHVVFWSGCRFREQLC